MMSPRQSPASPAPPRSPLSPTHPLMSELASLRQQLHQYQKAAHQSSIQLQGSRLELSLVKERNTALEGIEATLRAEVESLRSHPAPPQIQPQSTALTELSLAHRRLSAKLDLTEGQLSSASLELASAKQEIVRLGKERDSDRLALNELRRIEEDREEEIQWEKSERRKAEEQKKLCDLALQEYSTLVHSLDPSAVPPVTPSSSVANLLATPDLSDGETPEPSPASTTLSTADSISNLLVGQKGVHRLFHDFTSTLAAKEKALHSAHAKIEELQHSLRTLQEQLESETKARVAAQSERETAMRDDGSAAKVVERYMTFTQKTHATVHMHLDNLRARSTATQASLRSEISTLRSQLKAESSRAEKLRSALDEMSEGTSREAAGRRREVALRLKMLAIEEKRERKVEAWLDKVRRARAGAEGAVIEPDILEALLDEGVDAVEKVQPSLEQPKAWKRMLRKKPNETVVGGDEREESLARVLLAEELVNTLVEDLQKETERRTELEKQRVEWLAKEAVEGVPVSAEPAEGDDGHAMFDLDDEKPEANGAIEVGSDRPKGDSGLSKVDPEGPEIAPSDVDKAGEDDLDDVDHLDKPGALAPPPLPPPTPSPLSETPPLLPQLGELFAPLTFRYEPLQKRLHDLSHSLDSLRGTPSTPKNVQRKPLLNLSRRPDHTLETLLDSVHEVIEDARVDVEIALADEERVYRGFEALLGVGRSGAVQGKEVLRDAEEYVQSRREWEGFVKLDKRVQDVESDITSIKRVIHESEGMDTGEEGSAKWADIDLKTVSLPSRFPTSPMESEDRPKASRILSNVGRSFSSNIIGAPRRVGSFAGNLYRPKDKRVDGDAPGTPDGSETKESEGLLARVQHASDDVE